MTLPLSYSRYTLALVQERLGLQIEVDQSLFPEVAPVLVSDYLAETIDRFAPMALAINTEKARSEWLVAPILAEVRERLGRRISLFSGTDFDVDATLGL